MRYCRALGSAELWEALLDMLLRCVCVCVGGRGQGRGRQRPAATAASSGRPQEWGTMSCTYGALAALEPAGVPPGTAWVWHDSALGGASCRWHPRCPALCPPPTAAGLVFLDTTIQHHTQARRRPGGAAGGRVQRAVCGGRCPPAAQGAAVPAGRCTPRGRVLHPGAAVGRAHAPAAHGAGEVCRRHVVEAVRQLHACTHTHTLSLSGGVRDAPAWRPRPH